MLLIYCYGVSSDEKSAQGRNEGDENLDRFEASLDSSDSCGDASFNQRIEPSGF